jgi:hypothetical protein
MAGSERVGLSVAVRAENVAIRLATWPDATFFTVVVQNVARRR